MSDPLYGTADFSAGEYERRSSGGAVPAEYRANAQRTLEALQRVRDTLGVPVVITNGWRSPASNASITGAASQSQHLTAEGVDFDVPSMTKRDVAAALDDAIAAGELGDFHQLIYYLTDDHYHLGIGEGNQQLVRVDSSGYEPYEGAATLPDAHTPAGSGPWALVAVGIAAVVAFFLHTTRGA